MNKASRKIVESAAAVMNSQLSADTELGNALRDLSPQRNLILEGVNSVLQEVAEGGRLVTACETTGELLGFIPRSSVVPPTAALSAPPTSPDDTSA